MELVKKVLDNDRASIAKAITLVESSNPKDKEESKKLISSLINHPGHSIRVGFSGPPGVGKSTLINTIEPGLDLKTKETSDQHKQGQHTTTFAEMFDLHFDAKIIDTPGIKGFGVVDMDKEELGDYFPEFFALKQDCKFNNCIHINEPQCAVKDALENEEISWSRYKSYLQILEGEEENYRTDIWE